MIRSTIEVRESGKPGVYTATLETEFQGSGKESEKMPPAPVEIEAPNEIVAFHKAVLRSAKASQTALLATLLVGLSGTLPGEKEEAGR